MKRIYLFSALLFCVGVMVVFSCKKKDNTVPDNNANAMNEVFAGLRATPQTFTVQAGRDTVFTGAQGTILHFYPNSFKNASGAIVTSGAVNIELTEMYSPGDMVANRAPTTDADGKVLQSGGEVKIVAMQNGNKLYANKYGLGFKQGGYSSTPMELYYQGAINKDSTIAWKMSDTTGIGTKASETTKDKPVIVSSGNSYYFPGFYFLFDSCTNFNVINCDNPYNWGAGTTFTNIKVILPDNSLILNMQVFLIYPDIKGSASVSYLLKEKNTYTKFSSDVPVGKPYKIAVTAYKDGSAYYYETSGTTSADMVVNAVPSPETINNIRTRMHAL